MRLEPRQLEEYVQALRDGDQKFDLKEVRDAIIEHHMGLASSIARRIAMRYHRDWEDVKAQAFLILVEMVDRAPELLLDNSITPYLGVWITKECARYCREDQIFGPTDHFRRKKLTVKRHEIDEDRDLARDYRDLVDLSDSLEKILSPLECAVIILRMEGYSDEEIGARIDRSQQTVSRLRTRATATILSSDLMKEVHHAAA
jgi:RNA polymerase sigma factor (sigma-70 family)